MIYPGHARLKEQLSSITARRGVTAPTATEIMTTSIQVLETALKETVWQVIRLIF